jgi:hypothetical protein
LWLGVGQRPPVSKLPPGVDAEVLLQCGTLTGWLGSARNVAGAQEQAKDMLDTDMLLFLKDLLFTVIVPGAVAVYVPLRLAAGREWLPSRWGVAQSAALLLLACGCAVYFWCLWDFAVFGRGTPAPIDAPRRLVVRRLYRYV